MTGASTMSMPMPSRRFQPDSAKLTKLRPKTLLQGQSSLSKPVLKIKVVINGERRVSVTEIGQSISAMHRGFQSDATLKSELSMEKNCASQTKSARCSS